MQKGLISLYKMNFICAGESYNKREEHVAAPCFVKRFDYKSNRKCKLEIACTGFYRLFINGKEITKGYFAPYISNPDHYVYLDEYVLADLKEKDNELLVLLGNGFGNSIDFNIWDFENAPYRFAPKLYLGIYCGNKKIVETDESFSVFDSPITFDDYRAGERYDARLEENVFIRNKRKAVLCAAPNGEIKKCTAEPIKSFEKLFVKEIIENDEGYIFDFGKNTAGICKFKINGSSGQRIDFFYGEVVINGKLNMDNISFPGRNDVEYVQHGVYVCKDGYQEYQPSFAYYGFRYVFVKGLRKEQVSKDILECSVLHSDIKQSGEFYCDADVVNKIQDCVINSNYSNFYYFPTDCPHREKNGWLDDAGLSAEQFCYNHNAYDSLREWLFNIRKAQLKDGRIPGMVPTATWGYEWGSGPFTDIALMEIPYQLYRFYGKKEIIKENLPAIEKYLEYLSTKENQEGLYAFGLGDWCEIGHHIEGAWSTPLEFTDSALAVQMYLITAKLYEGINKKAKRNACLAEAERIKGNIRRKFVLENGELAFSTQTGLSVGIALGIFNQKEIPLAVKALVDLIVKCGEHLNVGIVGSKYILDVLCDYGYADLAYRMVVNPTWPSYADVIYKGGTSLWEIFMNFKPVPNQYERVDGEDRRVSLNHHFYGSVSAWFYRRLAGLNVISEKEIEICPSVIKDLTKASAKYKNGNRNISTRWDKKDGKVIITVVNDGFKGYIKYKDKTLKLKNGENILTYR